MIHSNAESGFSAYKHSAAKIELLAEQDAFLDVVEHMAFYGEMLVAVTGPLGSGKTTLANALIARRTDPEEGILITADMMLGMPTLIKRLAAQLNIEVPDNIVGGREALREEIATRVEDGKSILVVIDQAELLDSDTLNDIAHFSLVFPHGLSVVLIGLTGFEQQLRECPVQASVHLQPIKPLSEEGAQQLLQQVYAPNKSLPINQKEITAIYRKSGGWPGVLLNNAHGYFDQREDVITEFSAPVLERVNQFAQERIAPPPVSTNRFPLPHILALTALIMGILLAFFYSGQKEMEAEMVLAPPEDVLRGVLSDEQEADIQALDDLLAAEAIEQIPAAKVPSAPDYNYGETQAASIVEPVVATAPIEPISVAPVAAIPAPASKPAVVTSAPAPVIAVKPAVTEPADAKPIAAKPVPSQSGANAAPVVVKSTDKERLLAIKQGYVIQLFAGHDKKNADLFRQKWGADIKGALYQYETLHNDKSWFVVVAGTYQNRAEAAAALNSMPEKLRSQSPWVRSISSIHGSLR